MVLAERQSDELMAETALVQIEIAHRIMRDGGHAAGAADCDVQLPKARALVARSSREQKAERKT
jgi:hypothetical protein